MTCAPADAKAALRRRLLAARERRPPADRAGAGVALAERLVALAAACAASRVAAFVGTGTEPPTLPALDALTEADVAVLLPLVVGDTLDWAPYAGAGALAPGRLGIPAPTTRPLGPAALSRVELVILPALAVDRAGHRLGRGRGYYDRALATAAVPAYAVIFDDELLPALPHEPHDVAVTGAITPSGMHRAG